VTQPARSQVEEELGAYRDGLIGRREFLRRAGLLGVGAAASVAMVDAIQPAPAAQASSSQGASPFHVPEGDPSVVSEYVWYPSYDGTMIKGYLAWPAGDTADRSRPGVVVCHENRGLGDHPKDVVRRFAKQGYVALGPDLISRYGPPTDELATEADVIAAVGALPRSDGRDFAAGISYLKTHASVNPEKLACTGFCMGGGIVWQATTLSPDLKAAAPFYGRAPARDAIFNIRAAVFGVYGGLDQNTNASIPEAEAALQAAGITYRFKIYPDSPHGFFNDTGARYRSATAVEAWGDTLNWFAQYLDLPAPSL